MNKSNDQFEQINTIICVNSQKIFVVTGIGSHTNTTKLVITRRILTPLDSQSIKLIKTNSPGQLDNFVTILDIRFPNVSPGL